MLDSTKISGERGSPLGGKPGGLNNKLRAGPEYISPMPALLALASSSETAFEVWLESLSHRSDRSSSVGPIWLTSESGSREATIAEGVWPLLPPGPGIGKNRFGSMGDWPCFAVTIMSVESNLPLLFRCATISPIDLWANTFSCRREGVGVPIAS